MTKSKETNMRTKVSFLKMTRFGLKTTMKEMPITFLILNIFGVLRALQFGLITMATQMFFDSVEDAIAQAESISHVYWMIVLVSVVMVFGNLALQMHFFLWGVSYDRMDGVMKRLLHQKMSKINPILLEIPPFTMILTKQF